MSQQINLCTPILLTQKRYFSALAMAQALLVFLIFGGGLCAYWVWSLNAASANYQQTLATQARELEGLQAAIGRAKASANPLETPLAQDVRARQTELQQREKLRDELERGLFRPGWGHAARMQLLALSIPAQAWITEMTLDEHRLEVTGLTLDPAVLNEWVGQLAASPLLQGQALSAIKVEKTSESSLPARTAPAVSASAPAGAARPTWSFNLVSRATQPVAPAGGQP